MNRRTSALLVSGALLLGMAGAAAALPVPYVALSPGPVFDTLGSLGGTPVITIDGARTYPTEGQLDATTVYETGGPGTRLSLVEAFRGWLEPAVSVLPSKLLNPPGQTAQDAQQQGVQEMSFSQQDAVAAALQYLDKPVRQVVQVESVVNGSPADGILKPADRILRVDGQVVTRSVQVRRLISARKPGQDVQMTILRGSQRMVKTVGTEAAPDDPNRAIIGVLPGPGYISPITVDISLGNVAGPSAGLMFTLGIVDKLTPGPLTGGQHVAGTGTITANGRVGPIGGIAQKMSGARDNGADFFLAPAANCDEVAGSAPGGLQVVRIRTLESAVTALRDIAAGKTANLPSCST
jgi:PDZ domain-containing protein